MAAHSAAGETFEIVARPWHRAQFGRWSPGQATKVRQALERDVHPALGKLPIADIDFAMVLSMLRRIEERGAIDSAKRLRHYVLAVFSFAIPQKLCAADLAGKFVVGSLKPTSIGGSQPGLNTVEAIREMHAVMDASTSTPLTRLAPRLRALTFVPPGIVPTATWGRY